MPTRSTVVPKIRTVHPTTGKPICGAIRRNDPVTKKRARIAMADLGISEADLLKDPELFKRFVCHEEPDKDEKSWGNGRCKWHGSRSGRRPTTGKYTTYLTKIPVKKLEALKEPSRHDNLEEELDILSLFVQDELPKALGQEAGVSVTNLKKIVKGIKAAFMDFNMARLKDLIDKLEEEFASDTAQKESKRRVENLIQQYRDLAGVEYKRRSLSGEYIPRKEVIMHFGFMIEDIAKLLLNIECRTVTIEGVNYEVMMINPQRLIDDIRQHTVKSIGARGSETLEPEEFTTETARKFVSEVNYIERSDNSYQDAEFRELSAE